MFFILVLAKTRANWGLLLLFPFRLQLFRAFQELAPFGSRLPSLRGTSLVQRCWYHLLLGVCATTHWNLLSVRVLLWGYWQCWCWLLSFILQETTRIFLMMQESHGLSTDTMTRKLLAWILRGWLLTSRLWQQQMPIIDQLFTVSSLAVVNYCLSNITLWLCFSRLHQMDLSYCSMAVLITLLELIQPLSSGKRLLMLFKRRITYLSLMWLTRY